MTILTHEQAQSHLQARADRSLAPAEEAALEAHLEGCASCRDYAQALSELEHALRRATRARWGGISIPLPVRISGQAPGSPLLRFAGAPIAILFVVVVLATLTFLPFTSLIATDTPQASVSVAAVPTPGASLTITLASSSGCEPLIYKVQVGDSLESIAQKFSLPKDAIIQANDLQTEEITVSDTLIIPLCIPTPSPTTTLTNTSTPLAVTASRAP